MMMRVRVARRVHDMVVAVAVAVAVAASAAVR
jgi:hypothetical protein